MFTVHISFVQDVWTQYGTYRIAGKTSEVGYMLCI